MIEVDHLALARRLLLPAQAEQPVEKATALGILAAAHALVAIAERLPGAPIIVNGDLGDIDPEQLAEELKRMAPGRWWADG